MKCKHLIIGGGVVGLSVALNLLLEKEGKVCVIEKSYVGSGGATRNAGRYRVHFGARENTIFAIESAKYLKKLTSITGYNILLTQTGYLWLVYNEETAKQFTEKNLEYQKLGVPLTYLEPEEVYRKHPYLRQQKDLLGAFYGPQNGSFHHDAVIYGLWKKSLKLGGIVKEDVTAKKIITEKGRVAAVETDKGIIEADNVIVTAGAWSKPLLDQAGAELPLVPIRKEIMVTEPYKYTIDTFIIDAKRKTYFSQTLKGEIIGSCGTGKEKQGLVPQTNTIEWMRKFAKHLTQILKGADNIRIMRAWSGFYNKTPDNSHIIGRDREWPEGLYTGTGFSGHGFMMGPYAGKLLAEYIITGKPSDLMKPFLPTRFKENKLVPEAFVVG